MTSFEAYLRSIEEESLSALRTMVEINSFTHNREGVNRVGDLCVQLFEPLGFSARRVRSETEDCGDHLFLTRAGDSGAEIILVSHLDTVYPQEFAWREQGSLLHGPGVCDIKGGTILIWMVLRALRECAPELFGRLGFKILFNASEEGGCADFPVLAREQVEAKTRACFVYEAGAEAGAATTVVVSRNGCGRFRMEVAGHAAHSGNAHDQGASAIRELAGQVERIERLTDYERGITFNVGTIQGGTMVNCVPERASCLIDLRTANREDYQWGKRELMRLGGEGSLKSHDGRHGCRVQVTEEPGYPPWIPNEASDRLGALAVECGKQLGLTIVPTHRKGGSDGSWFFDRIPTLDGLGPVGRSPHRPNEESVERSSFLPRALLSIRLLQGLL